MNDIRLPAGSRIYLTRRMRDPEFTYLDNPPFSSAASSIRSSFFGPQSFAQRIPILHLRGKINRLMAFHVIMLIGKFPLELNCD